MLGWGSIQLSRGDGSIAFDTKLWGHNSHLFVKRFRPEVKDPRHAFELVWGDFTPNIWLNVCPDVNDISPIILGEILRPQIVRIMSPLSNVIAWALKSISSSILEMCFVGFKLHTMVDEGQMVPQNFVQRNWQIDWLVVTKKLCWVNHIVDLHEDKISSENLLQKQKHRT